MCKSLHTYGYGHFFKHLVFVIYHISPNALIMREQCTQLDVTHFTLLLYIVVVWLFNLVKHVKGSNPSCLCTVLQQRRDAGAVRAIVSRTALHTRAKMQNRNNTECEQRRVGSDAVCEREREKERKSLRITFVLVKTVSYTVNFKFITSFLFIN